MYYVLNVSKGYICHQGKEQECYQYIYNARDMTADLFRIMTSETKRKVCTREGGLRANYSRMNNFSLIIIIGQMNREDEGDG